MIRLKAGDRISVKIENNKVVSPYSNYTSIGTFDIIGTDYYSDTYYVYIPHYILLSQTVKIDNYNYKKFDLLPKYIGENILVLHEKFINSIIHEVQGTFCLKCNENYPFANPSNNEDFICKSCNIDM